MKVDNLEESIMHDLKSKPNALKKGDSLTKFILSQLEEKLYLVEPDIMEDKVNYVFKNGFVDVGDLPCRQHFWKSIKDRVISLPSHFNWEQIYYRPNDVKVDCSHFWHRPHHIAYWAKSELITLETGVYNFSLETSGGVYIWINKQYVTKFTPYTRNKTDKQNISLPLNAGSNQLLIYFDEMAERDTNFSFALHYLDDTPLWQSFGQSIDHEIEQLSSFWQNLNAQSSYFMQADPIKLSSTPLLSEDIEGDIIPIECCFFLHPHESEYRQYKTIYWKKGEALYDFKNQIELDIGFWSCQLNITISELTLKKTIIFVISPEVIPKEIATSNPLQSIQTDRKERFELIKEKLTKKGNPRIGRLIAALNNKTTDQKIDEELISIFKRTLQQISHREDCSDFLIIPLLWIWKEHAWEHFDSNLWSRARSVILGWRYWIDEPGNDSMWFWSENHCLCFHTAQYLAGSQFSELLFINSQRTGKQQQALGFQRLNLWFDHYEKTGFVEWNSIAYYPVDLIALLALYHLSPDQSIIERAKNAIDQLFTMLSIHAVQGRSTGSMGRAYEKEIFSGFVNELSTYVYALWGQGVFAPGVCSLPELIASHYQPPSYTDLLATWSDKNGFEARYCQGVNQDAKLVSWKNSDGLLSSVVDHKTGAHGHQQHVIDLSFAAKPDAKIWVNHPGELTPNGEGRPSYWAGNGILPRVNQYRNRALIIIDTKDHSISWSHLHLPQSTFDEVEISSHACFFKCGEGYGAILCSSELDPVTTGVTADIEFRANDSQVAWLFCLGIEHQDGGFSNFKEKMKQVQIQLTHQDDLKATINDPFLGLFSLSWSGLFEHPFESIVPKEWHTNPLISLDTDYEKYLHPQIITSLLYKK